MRAGWMMVLALAACAPAPPAKDDAASLVGAWRSHISFSSGPFAAIKDLEFMFVFHAGGTLTESSNYDAAPPVPPAYGVWRKTGEGKYEAHYEFYVSKAPPTTAELPNGWLPAGRGAFDETITLSSDGRSFTSTIRYQGFDAVGQATDKGDANGQGARMDFPGS